MAVQELIAEEIEMVSGGATYETMYAAYESMYSSMTTSSTTMMGMMNYLSNLLSSTNQTLLRNF